MRVLPRRPRVVAGAGIIGAVRQFCQAFNRQLAKFPFDPTASEEATLAEMIDMFHPETGDVANLIRNDLSEIVDVRASGVVAKNGATPTPNASLLNFLNRARNVGSALWREGANEPTLAFTVRFLPGEAVPNITFNVDGQTGRYSRTSTPTGRFSWIGTRAREAMLTGRVAGRDENLLRFDGQWALFNFFYQASDWRRSARDRVIWDIPWQGSNVRVEAEVFFLGEGEPIVTRDYFPATTCPIQAF